MTIDEIASDVLEELRFDTDEASRAETVTRAIRAALAARDAEVLAKLDGWRREHRYEGPFNPEDIYEELRAMLSEGKPGQ